MLISTSQKLEVKSKNTEYFFTNEDHDLSNFQVCVIVPVRNEASHLFQTLEALRKQTDDKGQPLASGIYEVLVLINNSTDRSLPIALKYARDFPKFRLAVANIILPSDQAHIGTVRRLLMDQAYDRFMQAKNYNGIIASTDGDTIVDSQWIYHIIAEIEKGNDAVGGRILTRKKAGSARLFHLRDVTYRCLLTQAEALIDPQIHNPFPCHFQYFGANMAVTCKMYKQAGKLPVLPFLEDAAFHNALMQQDARIRKSFNVKVYTSARTNGRVQVGFSEQLRRWKAEDKKDKTQMVEHVSPYLLLFSLRSRLRNCWCNYQNIHLLMQDELAQLASLLRVNPNWLIASLTKATYFGPLWDLILQSLHPDLDPARSHQPIDQAISQLRQFIRNPLSTAFHKNPAGRSHPAAQV